MPEPDYEVNYDRSSIWLGRSLIVGGPRHGQWTDRVQDEKYFLLSSRIIETPDDDQAPPSLHMVRHWSRLASIVPTGSPPWEAWTYEAFRVLVDEGIPEGDRERRTRDAVAIADRRKLLFASCEPYAFPPKWTGDHRVRLRWRRLDLAVESDSQRSPIDATQDALAKMDAAVAEWQAAARRGETFEAWRYA